MLNLIEIGEWSSQLAFQAGEEQLLRIGTSISRMKKTGFQRMRIGFQGIRKDLGNGTQHNVNFQK